MTRRSMSSRALGKELRNDLQDEEEELRDDKTMFSCDQFNFCSSSNSTSNPKHLTQHEDRHKTYLPNDETKSSLNSLLLSPTALNLNKHP